MKKQNWYLSFSLVDDKYVAEARPDKIIKKNKGKVILSFVAACACLALLFCNLWLFVPFNTSPPDVSRYSDSEYYRLIKKLNLMTYQKPKYKNNAEKLWTELKYHSLGVLKSESLPPDAAVPDINEGSTGTYQEITDNQVEGIIEADRIKRSDTHIYYLSDNILRIYQIDKENTTEVGRYDIDGSGSLNYYVKKWEFYLSSDCKTVTVVTQYFKKYSDPERFVKLVSLDVSDPENIVKKAEFTVTGAYMSSRLTNGSILLLTEFVIDKQNLNFDDETTFLPQIDEGNGFHSIPASSIVAPNKLNSTRYTVVMQLDENTLDLKATAAYLSYSDDVYVSEDHVFFSRVFADKKKDDNGNVIRNSITEISCLTYGGDSFEKKGSVTVRGYLKDQWSMDEHEGVLRVFTTTNATVVRGTSYDNGSVSADILQTATGSSNASLYCIDLSSFEIVASVIDFAPPREEIQSVRFDGDTAYVCTSIELSDPVFFFDLSDLNNITYKDTGTIEGFSTSLINLGNGYLLGIGRGNRWDTFKVEVYEEIEDDVRSVCTYELDKTEYSTDYKSCYVDRENQLIGIGVRDTESRYIVLHFDGYELIELVNEPILGEPYAMRGVFIDGYMYIFGNNYLVKKIFNG